MEAGKLDRRLTLLRLVKTTNAMNEEEESWTSAGTVWASKKDASDRDRGERMVTQEIAATISTRFRVRHSSLADDIRPTWRVQCEGRTYDVRIVKELGRKVGWEISAEARAE